MKRNRLKKGFQKYLLIEQKIQGRMLGKGYHTLAVKVTTWLLRAGIIGLTAYTVFNALNYVIDWMSHHKVMIILTVFALSWLLIPLFMFLEAKHSKVPFSSIPKSDIELWDKRKKDSLFQREMKRWKEGEKEFERIRQAQQQRIDNERQNRAMGCWLP